MKAKPQSPIRATGWPAIRQQMADWPQPALIALGKVLYDPSPANREFLRARYAGTILAGQN